jgi:hypothetical protein
MIYAATREEIEARRKAFIREWSLKHRTVGDSLEEAGDRLFTFTRLPDNLPSEPLPRPSVAPKHLLQIGLGSATIIPRQGGFVIES